MGRRDSGWDLEDPHIGYLDERNVRKTATEKQRKDRHNPTAQRPPRPSMQSSDAANYLDHPGLQADGYRNHPRPPPPQSQLSLRNTPSDSQHGAASPFPPQSATPTSATPTSANVINQDAHRNNPRYDNPSQNSPRLQDFPSQQSKRSGTNQQPTTSIQNYPRGQPSSSAQPSTTSMDERSRARTSYSDSASSFMGDLSDSSSQPYGFGRPSHRSCKDTTVDCNHGPLEVCINCEPNRKIRERSRRGKDEREERDSRRYHR